jgi:CHASE2 domain-containing sensor protein
LLNGRIVLIGTSLLYRDQHATPLSVIEGPTHGAMIHAQALAQRLDGNRDIVVWPWWMNLSNAAIVALGCFVAARKLGVNPRGLAFGVLGLIAIGLASFLAFGAAAVCAYLFLRPAVLGLGVFFALGLAGMYVSARLFDRLATPREKRQDLEDRRRNID